MTENLMTQRPIIPGFHPDPSICRVGDTYYLVCSSFEYAPGVPIFASADLRSWEQIGNVLDRASQLNVIGAVASGGIFAPTLRHHDGRFWMITTNMTDGLGHLLVTAGDPAGPWSDPVRITGALGIDPDLAWDGDGTCYLTWAAFDPAGLGGISQAVLDPTTGELLSERRLLWQGAGGKHPEGPHLYRIGDHWYLLLAEGGTEKGHAVTIARGPSPAGPFEPCPDNPLITARGTASPVQNTGHADLVQRPDGSWVMVYLGVRARGGSPQWHVLGRETFASEIKWRGGWPVVGAPVEPDGAPTGFGQLGDGLPASWVSPGHFPQEVLRRDGGGWFLSATVGDPAADDLSFVGRRQENLYATVTATVRASAAVGGLSVRLDGRHHLDLEIGDGRLRAVAQVGEIRSVLGEVAVDDGADVMMQLRMEPAPGSVFSTELGPDRLVAGIVRADGFAELGHLDGRYLSTELAGGFTGRLIGFSCHRGTLEIKAFEYLGADDPDGLPASG